ncbi:MULTISPECIES: ABC transporter ATP-binding protein [Brochothrix]|uniref:ABC transporter ATP-binding protein n=1 Tax=Brochothrix thermosphacta TaxID=2756 RepID=A0A1D2L1R2_BROTH|nr:MULTISPECIES: ABC transporter ATP-binding protein [Brochothrix]SLN00351.1 ABC transporter, ATP-binding protein [Brachybacterium faecium]ANZ94562.1 bacitracin ABC transporter ATP-binding protein [Brochothrix thermosphacta]ANZ97128.1 bacitracin ABC transporter ATP-binding protein [Brochothrix thermosphacta]ATF26571.1 ABC transporter ATP-binding protein [Brochothrix thermosphacta]ATH85926.1 ABC transporter ATP-binding protein [Brochothrix thermosphacta]
MEPVLSVKHIRKIYGKNDALYTAINGISFDIPKGEFVGIMGPSGAGKTSLLNILSTIDEASSGEVFVDGVDLLNLTEKKMAQFRKEKLGFIFQEYNLIETLTIKENIILPLTILKFNKSEIERRYQKTIEAFHIEDTSERLPSQISGGQRQRAAAARAFISSPAILFADEPTGALDSNASTEFLQLLAQRNKVEKTTILMVTHDAYAASYCERILFIKDGTIFTELYKGKRTRQAFLKSILDVLAVIGGAKDDFSTGLT